MQVQAFTLNSGSSVVGVKIVPPALQQAERCPFNLALFLDTSTSMSGERLTSVKHTLNALIDHMGDTDALTLIEYNSKATVLCQKCSDKEQLKEITDKLKANRSTNLEKALYAFPTGCIPDSICILTDGDNTEGLSGTEELLFLAKRLLPQGVSVCCLGYGADHNEKLLQTLALRSRGSYTYMSNGEMVPVAIGTIVGSLESEVARNAYIVLSEGRQCLELLPAEDSRFVIGSLFSEKTQWVVLDIPDKEKPILLNWCNRFTGESHIQEIPIVLSDSRNDDVYEQYLRIKCLKCMEAAKQVLEMRDRSKYPDQITAVTELLAEMEHEFERPLLLRLQAQLTELLKTLKDMSAEPEISADGLPARPPPAWWIGRQPNNAYLTRLTSDMTTFTVQRGVLSACRPDRHVSGDPMNDEIFSSPVQRQVTGAITQGYHSQVPDTN